MANYDFNKDLLLGEEGEKIVALYLMLGHNMKFIGYNDDNRFDILMSKRDTDEKKTFEVKTDYYVKEGDDTGNIAVEIRHNSLAVFLLLRQMCLYIIFVTCPKIICG